MYERLIDSNSYVTQLIKDYVVVIGNNRVALGGGKDTILVGWKSPKNNWV